MFWVFFHTWTEVIKMADRSVELEFNTNLDDIEKQITGLSNKVREIQNKSVPIKVQFDLTDLQTTILSLQNSFNSAMQRISPSTEINNVLSDTKKQLEQARTDLDKYTKELDELRAKPSAESNSVWDVIGAGAGDPALVKINELNEKIKEQSDLIAKLGMNYTRQESVATSAANAQIRAQQAATSAIEKEEKKRASAQRKHNTDEILKYQLQLKELIQTYRHGDTSLISKEQAAADRQRILETQEAYREAVKSMGEDPTLKQKIYFLEETSLQALDAISDREKQISKEEAAANSQKTKNEEELRKKRKQARTEMIEGVKSVAKLYSDTINSTVNTIRNGLKTIKSLSADLSSILGIEDVQLNVNSILKQSLSTYAGVYESVNLLDQMYEKDISTMLDWAENNAKAYGIASQNAREYLGQISGMLSNLGVESDAVRETMTTNYVKMAGDLASAFNKSTDQAFLAIRSGIAGMTRPLEQFGINLKITALDEWVKNNDKIHKQLGNIAYKDLTEANKQLVRYAYILEKAYESQGDFAKTSASFSNEIKTLKNEWQNLLELIGKYAVPVFRPVVEWIIKAIQYTKYFIQVLAETFGWQIEQEQDTVKFYQEETQATEDTTDALKDKNKELKKGVKLLDLYELDFGDDDKNNGADIGDIQGAQSLLEGLADDYKDLEFNFKFKLNDKEMREVRKFIDKVEKFFNSVWNFKIGPFPSIGELIEDAIDKLKSRPGEFILDIMSTIFATNTIKNVAKNVVGPYLKKVLTSDNVLEAIKNPSVYDRIMGIGTALAGAVMAGFGGYNWGQAIANGNAFDGLVGAFETISGVAIGAAGGFMAGGPVGAAVGAGVALATALITGITGYLDEKQNIINEHTDSLFTNTDTYIVDKLKGSFTFALDNTVFDEYKRQVDTLKSDRDIIISNLSELEKKITLSDEKPSTETLSTITGYYSDLATNIGKISSEEKTFTLSTITTAFSEFGLPLGETEQTLSTTYGILKDLKAQVEQSELKELSKLTEEIFTKPKDAITQEDLDRYEELKDKYIGTADGMTAISDGLASIKISADDYKSLEDYDKALNDMTGSLQDLYDEIAGTYDYSLDAGTISENLYSTDISKWNAVFEAMQKRIDSLRTEATKQLETNVSVKVAATYADQDTKDALNALTTAKTELEGEGFENLSYKELITLTYGQRYEAIFEDVQSNTAYQDIPEDTRKAIEKYYGIDPTSFGGKQTVIDTYAALTAQQTFEIEWRSNVRINEDTGEFQITVSEDLADNLEEYLNKIGVDYSQKEFGAEGIGILPRIIAGAQSEGRSTKLGAARTFSITTPITVDNKLVLKSISKVNIDETSAEQERKNLAANLKPIAEAGAEKGASDADYSSAANTTASNYTEATADAIENDADKLTEATSNAIATAANTDEANQKGSELGNAYMDGLATAINTNSNYKSALQQLVEGFKNALNSISSNINEWSKHLSDGVAALNIPDDVTFSSLMGILKTNNLNIKPLATGGVIPPNNPFLAMLGDQRSGVNIEAPLTTIQDAVREVVQPEQNIEVSVYIGNQELRDFVVDTVVDNNLIKG